ncbi:hypothetical protein [Sediminibacillus halophilus]|nr:hypothetical protein [Sediminibacillus halophilus]
MKWGKVGFSMLLFKITVKVPNKTETTTSHLESIFLIRPPPYVCGKS